MFPDRSSISRGSAIGVAVPIAIGMAAALAMLATGNAHANLILNGNFSANAASYTVWPGYPNGTATGSSNINPAAPTDWTLPYVSGIGINGPDTGFYATQGAPFAPSSTAGVSDFVFMNGPPTGYPQSFISQTVATVPGQAYTLTYEAAGTAGDTTIGVLSAVVEDTTSDTNLATQTPAITETAFNTFTLGFTATSVSTMVEFLKNQDPNNSVDVANVSLVATPEPGALYLAAAGMLGLVLLRRRKAV